jgi:alpha-glucosidase
MRRFLLLSILLLVPFYVFSQAVTSYEKADNRTFIFRLDNSAALALKCCSPEILRITYLPSGRYEPEVPSYAVINEEPADAGTLNISGEGSSYELYTSQLRIVISKEPVRLRIYDKYQKLLFSDTPDNGHTTNEAGYIVSSKLLRDDEQIFGLGEKAGPMSRRVGTFKMWNSDKPCYSTTEDPLYKSIPFFMSSYHYGIFFDNTYKTVFRFGTENSDTYSFSSPGGSMVYYFIYGRNYKEILTRYVALTGKPIMPPRWAFGFAQCRGLYTNEELAREVARTFREKQIPCDVIYQDIGWTQYLQDFTWREENYTNPGGMISDLAAMGFKMIVSQDPVVSQKNREQWKEADSLGYFTKDTCTGLTYDMPWPWGGSCGVVDFTKPGVADWWGAYQQKPLDMGVKGFWTDMGEPAWSNEENTERLSMRHYDGMHDRIHNVYGLTWDKVVTEQFNKRNPGKRIFQMTRAGYAGIQRYAFSWTGDSGNGTDVTQGWEQMAGQIPVMLSAGLSGIPFITCDISGYCGDIADYSAMAELYIRWMQLGVFTPLSRAHHEGNWAVEPWQFGPVAEAFSKSAIELKYTLIPYIYSCAREAHDMGWPIMRSMFFEFPEDRNTYLLNEQFMFGSVILVAPVLEKGALTKKVYLPKGEWVDFYNRHTVYSGGAWITVEAPLSRIPLFIKKGSVIPTQPVLQYLDEVQGYPVWFEVIPGNETATCTFYEDDGESTDYLEDGWTSRRITCTPVDKDYSITIEAPRKGTYANKYERRLGIRLYCDKGPKAIKINGRPMRKKTFWNWDSQQGVCTVMFPDIPETITVDITYNK